MTLPVMEPDLWESDATLERWARAVDDGPFSSLCFGERMAFDNPDSLVLLGACAAWTSRVRLVTTVIVPQLHDPVRLAKSLATGDRLSGGRLTVGLGVGGREEDYRAVGATFTKARLRRLEEQVGEMRRVWGGEAVVAGVARGIGPTSPQPGGPELLAGSIEIKSIERSSHWADGICGFSFGPDAGEVDRAFSAARASWTSAERKQPPRLVTSCFYALGPDARENMDRYVKSYLDFLGPEVAAAVAPMCRVTSIDALRAVLRELEDCGTDELLLVPTTAGIEQLDRVADLIG